MPLASSSRLGPYEIVAPLGAGGMGEVYRAKDTRLGREVAIKGLPAAFASHPERLARFEREARLLASLNHPNIATIFGLEDASGVPYLVLELIEGETLERRLARGPLPLREALDVAAQIAAAIEAAHDRDVIHRDLKPGNVMVTAAGGVKVLDFGLARSGAIEAASSSGMSMSPTVALGATGAGMILGTASYMSPEQARGQGLDRRTDVWAFGCVLFECLTGKQVFAGDTVSDVIARILEREPDWNALPGSVTPKLRDLLRRCLTKDVERRPASLAELRRELGAMAGELSSNGGSRAAAAPATAAPSLAVLYFENLSSGTENDYFCAGITEDILTDLSKIKGLRVASRNAVARYRGTQVDPAKVATELGVAAVLEGSVRRAGDRVRITAQLINAADGFHLWAERYDRTMDDVFAVQEEIASAIAQALRGALSPSEAAAIAKAKPQDVRAYDLYLKGRQLYGQYDEGSLRAALDVFRQAIGIDADYALAWAGIADCHAQLCQWGRVDIAEQTRLGLEAARRAMAIDPRLPEAYKAEALNLGFTGDMEGAEASLLKAIEVDPRFLPAILNMTVASVTRADLAAAERYTRRALDIDPHHAFAVSWLMLLTSLTRREDESIALGHRMRKMSDESFYVTASHVHRAFNHFFRGDRAAAMEALREGRADGGRPDDLDAAQTAIDAHGSDADRTRAEVRRLRDRTGLMASSQLMLVSAAVRASDLDSAVAILSTPLLKRLSDTIARLLPALHPILDRAPFAPRRSPATLVWPLEAPMLDASVHLCFREVKIESGLPVASGLQ